MSNNNIINQDFLDQYAAVFADKVSQQAYEGKTHLNGKDILKLSSIKQLNLFVIKTFFTEWQEEVKKLESPLFDYSARDVRKAMVTFMNVLSQHIHITQKDLKPYIEKALIETITLAKDPILFLNDEFASRRSQRLSSRLTKPLAKYLVYYKEDMLEFFSSVDGEPVRDALGKAEVYFGDFHTDELFAELVSEMSNYLVLTVDELLTPTFGNKETIPEPVGDEEESSAQWEQDMTTSSSDYFQSATEETPDEEDHDHTDDEKYDEDPLEDDFKEEERADTDLSEDEDETEAGDYTEDKEVLEEEPGQEESIADEDEEIEEDDEPAEEEAEGDNSEEEQDYSPEELETINKKFEEDHKTLAELHEAPQVESVFEAISINHRYMFLQELFDGDNEVFTSALKDVDECKSFDGAVEMLVQNYAKDYFWDMNSEEVKELLKVIYRKFRDS